MIMLTAQPSINELNGFIRKIPKYPLTLPKLLRIATDSGASKELVSFYKTFTRDQVFDNEKDLAGRTEQLQIMNLQEMPEEKQLAPEEY